MTAIRLNRRTLRRVGPVVVGWCVFGLVVSTAAGASAQTTQAARTWRLEPSTALPRSERTIALANPTLAPLVARITIRGDPQPGEGGGRNVPLLRRAVTVPATSQRLVHVADLLAGSPLEPGRVTVRVECTVSGSDSKCPDTRGLAVEDVTEWFRPDGGDPDMLASAIGPTWLRITGLTRRLVADPPGVYGEAIVLANPGETPANVHVELVGDGPSPRRAALDRVVQPRTRLAVRVGAGSSDPETGPFRNEPFTALVSSDVPVVAERAARWPWTRPGSPLIADGGFRDRGPERASQAWHFAEGYTGVSPSGQPFETYFIVANPDRARTAIVEVTYLRDRGRPVVAPSPGSMLSGPTAVGPGAQAIFRADAVSEMVGVSFGTVVRSLNGVPLLATRVIQWKRPPAEPADPLSSDVEACLVAGGIDVERTAWAFPANSDEPDAQTYVSVSNANTVAVKVRGTYLLPDGTGARIILGVVPPRSRATFSNQDTPPITRMRAYALIVESLPAAPDGPPVPFTVERSVFWGQGGDWRSGRGGFGSPWESEPEVPPVRFVTPPSPLREQLMRFAPWINLATWLVAALLVAWSAVRRGPPFPLPRPALRMFGSADGVAIERARTILLVAGACWALCLPSSTDGEVSRNLTMVALVGTVALLAGLLALPGGLGGRRRVVNAAALLLVLTLATAVTPLRTLSPGVPFIYLAVAILLALDCRPAVVDDWVRTAFAAVNAFMLAVGLAIVLGIPVVATVLTEFYTQYYKALLPGMLGDHKPVITFATHSMAAFVHYLMFYAVLLGYQSTERRRWLGLAIAYLVMLASLRSTTANILLCVAVVQIAWQLGRKHPEYRWRLAAGALLLAAGAAAWLWASGRTPASLAAPLILGHRAGGIMARFGPGGSQYANLRFIWNHPLAPVGFGYSDSLYFGDSGIVLSWLRGGLPAVACLYGGLFAFLWSNVKRRGVALWLWCVTTAFEIGFQPLLSFRFVALVPFYLVCVNSLLEAPAARLRRPRGDRSAASLT